MVTGYLLRDVPALLFGDVVALLLRGEERNLLDDVHAVLHSLGGAGQVRGGAEHMEALHLGNVVTFGHRNLLRDGNGRLLTSPGGVSFAAWRGVNFSLGDHRFRVVQGLGRMMDTVMVGVVLHMKFFLGIVVKWLGFVQVYNVLYGRVV